MEVLILPRLLALVVAMPLMTFIADMAALSGGAWSRHGSTRGISPEAFATRLQDAIGMNTYLGRPDQIAIHGAGHRHDRRNRGLQGRGLGQSLGRHVTASVVNSIFMVIFVDGLFAIFFAGIHY